MKKKIILLLCLFVGIFTLTGCGETKKEKELKKITYLDKESGYQTVFSYDEEKVKYEDVKVEEDGGKYEELSFKSTDKNLEFESYYVVSRAKTYNDSQEDRKEHENYKEYTFGKYKGYSYGHSDEKLTLNIILEEDGEDYIYLFVSVETISNTEKNIKELFEDKDIQDTFNSLKFEKTK